MGMKFRVLRGSHNEGKYPKGHPWVGRGICYVIGEIVDSASNLAKFNCAGPLGPKFQRIHDSMPATDKVQQGLDIAKQIEEDAVYDDGNGQGGPMDQLPPADNLDSMTLAELKKSAKEDDIELSPQATKSQIIDAIRKVYA